MRECLKTRDCGFVVNDVHIRAYVVKSNRKHNLGPDLQKQRVSLNLSLLILRSVGNKV